MTDDVRYVLLTLQLMSPQRRAAALRLIKKRFMPELLPPAIPKLLGTAIPKENTDAAV